ncbi:hypothetical protein ACP70R_035948 [Stipagrostis hirtigluma subsp. patula]
MASKQGSNRPAAAAAGEEVDAKYEWQDNATSYVLRLHLTGFRKEDFRVQVDGAGRLTVRGQRAAGGGKQYRLHKVFQLPANANLDEISGRFDAGVLTLTVPKRPAAPPATVEEIIKKPAQEPDDAKPKVADEAKKPSPSPPPQEQGKPRDEAKKQAERKEEMKKPQDDAKPKEDGKKKAELAKEEVDAKRSKQEPQEKKAAAPPPPAARKEEDKPKAEAAAAAPTEKKQAPPETKEVDQESLAERVRRRRAEEEREKVTAAAAAEEAESQRRQTAACGGWKERVAEELEGLTSSEWAESLVETVKKNKEVIAVAAAVAALSVGLFVSRRLFSRN